MSLNNTEILIYDFIKVPCKREKLRSYLLSRGVKITDRQMRKTVENMVLNGYLIGTSNKIGYFRIENADDLETALMDYKSKGKSLFKRANKLFNSFYKKDLEPEFIFK